jgi:hypothetical protein
MILQPLGIVIQGARVRRLVMVIPREHEIVDVLVEGLLLGTEQNHFWPSPIRNPISNISGRL